MPILKVKSLDWAGIWKLKTGSNLNLWQILILTFTSQDCTQVYIYGKLRARCLSDIYKLVSSSMHSMSLYIIYITYVSILNRFIVILLIICKFKISAHIWLVKSSRPASYNWNCSYSVLEKKTSQRNEVLKVNMILLEVDLTWEIVTLDQTNVLLDKILELKEHFCDEM